METARNRVLVRRVGCHKTAVCCRGLLHTLPGWQYMHACFSSLHSVHHDVLLLLLPLAGDGGSLHTALHTHC